MDLRKMMIEVNMTLNKFNYSVLRICFEKFNVSYYGKKPVEFIKKEKFTIIIFTFIPESIL